MGPDGTLVERQFNAPEQNRQENLSLLTNFSREYPQIGPDGRLNYLFDGSCALAIISSAESIEEVDILDDKDKTVIKVGDIKGRLRISPKGFLSKAVVEEFSRIPFTRKIGDLDVMPMNPEVDFTDRFEKKLVDEFEYNQTAFPEWPLEFGFLRVTIGKDDQKREFLVLSPETLVANKIFQLMAHAQEAGSKEKFFPETEAMIRWARRCLGDDYAREIAQAVMAPENMRPGFKVPTDLTNFQESETLWFIREGMVKHGLYAYLEHQWPEVPDLEKHLPWLAFWSYQEEEPIDPKSILNTALAEDRKYLARADLAITSFLSVGISPAEVKERFLAWRKASESLEGLVEINYSNAFLFASPEGEALINAVVAEVNLGRLSKEDGLILLSRLHLFLPELKTEKVRKEVMRDKEFFAGLVKTIKEATGLGMDLYASDGKMGIFDLITERQRQLKT